MCYQFYYTNEFVLSKDLLKVFKVQFNIVFSYYFVQIFKIYGGVCAHARSDMAAFLKIVKDFLFLLGFNHSKFKN